MPGHLQEELKLLDHAIDELVKVQMQMKRCLTGMEENGGNIEFSLLQIGQLWKDKSEVVLGDDNMIQAMLEDVKISVEEAREEVEEILDDARERIVDRQEVDLATQAMDIVNAQSDESSSEGDKPANRSNTPLGKRRATPPQPFGTGASSPRSASPFRQEALSASANLNLPATAGNFLDRLRRRSHKAGPEEVAETHAQLKVVATGPHLRLPGTSPVAGGSGSDPGNPAGSANGGNAFGDPSAPEDAAAEDPNLAERRKSETKWAAASGSDQPHSSGRRLTERLKEKIMSRSSVKGLQVAPDDEGSDEDVEQHIHSRRASRNPPIQKGSSTEDCGEITTKTLDTAGQDLVL
jgi:hypothetical protein